MGEYHVALIRFCPVKLARAGPKNGDFIMHTPKLLVAALLLALSLGLGGCFHHAQAVAAEPLPPPVSHPLK